MPAGGLMIAGAVAAPIIGGIVGNVMSAGDRKSAQKAMKQAYAELKKVGLPPDLSAQILNREFSKVGILTPELEEDLHLAKSEFESIQEDPELRNTQMEALNRVKQQMKGGIAGDERAALNQILQETRQDQSAKQAQILADQQRRGMGGGSGNALVAQLQASQSGADQAASQGDALMKLIAERVRSGANDAANLGGNIRAQDYQKASDRAQALDARNQFQYTNSMARQTRNTNSKNNAQATNLAEQQRIQDANTAQYNNELLRQRNEQGAYWDRKLGYGTALANAKNGQAASYSAQAQQKAAMGAGIGQGVGQGLSAYAKYNAQNPGTAEQDDDLAAVNYSRGGTSGRIA